MGGRSSGLGFRHGLPLGVGRSITGPVYDERLGHLGLGSGYVQKWSQAEMTPEPECRPRMITFADIEWRPLAR